MSQAFRPDPWTGLRRFTQARIALGRAGAGLPTEEVLRQGMAHALARDAVHSPFEADRLRAGLEDRGWQVLEVRSAAPDRATYLRRPDLGRQLDARSAEALQAVAAQGPRPEVLIVLADGLSAAAVHRQALPLLDELLPLLQQAGARIGPLVLAHQARVALGDAVGEPLDAGLVLMLIGERPGLSAPDSLGAYLTLNPRAGCADSARNCVSNIRPEGLPAVQAAAKIAWLIGAARRLGATGIALKDESGVEALPPAPAAA